MSKWDYSPVAVRDVEVDRTQSPWGRVRCFVPGKSKEGSFWIYFHSREEWGEFCRLWTHLDDKSRYGKTKHVLLYGKGKHRGFWRTIAAISKEALA